ncbi:ATP-grasp ribosomal peptide maturase [Streptomyces uncialis]|uniref:ATP-grasp ribosomal peptide maturase n=1 Tax=Streptomyces uncialis TaxID=1048205 RepID=UPI003808D481
MTVLVLAARDDWPTDRIVAALTDRGTSVFRMDTADFPGELRVTARIDATATWHGPLASPVRTADLSEVTAVYYRAPGAFSFPEGMSGPERRFAAAQARAGLGGLINALDCCRWVNHPASMTRAEYKPWQLKAARDAGLVVAPTLVTHVPEAVRKFADEVGGDLVCKPVASPVLIEDGTLKTVYTRRLTTDDLQDLRGIGTTCHLFQAWIDKAHEVRLTVVGDRLFAAEVHAGSSRAHVDWRSDYASLTYLPAVVPQTVETGVLRLMGQLGLRFAAIDFVVSPDGRWTFLEANPCGQGDWIEAETGLPLTDAIADELAGASL